MMRHPKDLDGIGLHAPEHAENVLSFPMRVVLKPQLSRRTLDHFFWCGMALLLTGGVLLGFAHTYYFAGFLRAKLPSTIIQIHGVVFSLWFVGLLVQTFLVPFGRIHWHRRIGFVNYGVAVLVVVFGVWAAVDALRRGVQIGSYDLSASFAVSSMDMVAFSAVIIPSYFARRRPDAHKRLILFATLSIMDAALDRWPYEKMGATLFGSYLDLSGLAVDARSL